MPRGASIIGDDIFKLKTPVSAISQAAGSGNFAIVTMLLDHASDAERKASQDAIISAAVAGQLDMLHFMLSQGFDVNYRSPTRSCGGETTLLAVCKARTPHPQMLQLLLEKGTDLHAQSLHGDTPRKTTVASCLSDLLTRTSVHKAAEASNPDIVEILLNAGARTDTQNQDEDIPLIKFAKKLPEFCLHKHKNDLHARGPNPRLDSFEKVLQHTENVNAANGKGNTALHTLALSTLDGYFTTNRVPAAQLLLRAGADMSLRNADGLTALDICAGNKEYNDTRPSPKRDVSLPEFLAAAERGQSQ